MPMHVVCRWMGNSKPVAAEHYLQVTDEHFRKAVESRPEKCATFCAASDEKPEAAHFAAQQGADTGGGSRNRDGSEMDESVELVGTCSDSLSNSRSCSMAGNARGGSRTRTPCGTGS
jgi:hypothetical protein